MTVCWFSEGVETLNLPRDDDAGDGLHSDANQHIRRGDHIDLDERRADVEEHDRGTRTPHRVMVELAGVLALVVVAVASAGFAELFKTAIATVGSALAGRDDVTEVARTLPGLTVLAIGTGAAFVAVLLGRSVAGSHRPHGMTGLADAVSGRGAAPSLRTTGLRAGGTWLASCGLLSIGRESAILETGGTLGWRVGQRLRWLRRFAPALAAGGVSAAFAAAYHAPIAGMLYVEEHLRGRRDVRSLLYTLGGAIIAHLSAVHLFGGHALLPSTQGSRAGMIVLVAVGVVPAVVGSRLFLYARDRAAGWFTSRSLASTSTGWLLLLAPLAAVAIVLMPLTAGNGMDALHHASTETTLAVALALAAGKLLATAVAFAAGVPGGSFWATLAVSSGWALLAFVTLDAAGLDLPGTYWDGMMAAMAVGIAVGLRSPLVGAFAVAEMAGDLTLVPILALAVAAAVALDRGGEHWYSQRRRPIEIHDEDA